MTKTKVAKCSRCLPDLKGAILEAGLDFSESGDLVKIWECRNCGNKTPRKTLSPKAKITPSQQKVIDRLTAAGWILETSFIGRKVWVSGKKDRGSMGMNLIAGDSFYGTIGAAGSFSLKLQRLGGEVEVDDDTGIYVYLDQK
jgi:hypothetical protein